MSPLDTPIDLYSAPGWEKRSIGSYHTFVDRKVSIGSFYVEEVRRTHVEIHYMVNTITLGIAQVKFKNTIDQGCVGKKHYPPPAINKSSTDGVNNMSLIIDYIQAQLKNRKRLTIVAASTSARLFFIVQTLGSRNMLIWSSPVIDGL